VRPLGRGNGTFNSYVICFSVVVSVMSLGVKVGIRTPEIVRIVLCVGKDSVCCWCSGICGRVRDGGLASILTWGWCYFVLGR
jgi:hypothetical protein